MNFENFTIKAQEAVQKAQEIATVNQNQAIETSHLLKGILIIFGKIFIEDKDSPKKKRIN